MVNKEYLLKGKLVKSRIVYPPIATEGTTNGEVTSNILDYYDRKVSLNNIGITITEHAYVNINGIASVGQISISKDEDIEGLAKLAKVIKSHNSLAICQIAHAGSNALKEISKRVIGPSAVINPAVTSKKVDVPIEATLDDIKQLIEDFSNAGLRAYKAGFDGIELHGAHGYLLDQFFSPITNVRNDMYGSKDPKDRIRIITDIIKAIRSKTSKDFIIDLRLGVSDFMENGATIEDSVAILPLLEEAGLDILHVGGGLIGALNPNSKEEGYFKELAIEIRKHTKLPLILTGGFKTLVGINRELKEDYCDFVGVGRSIYKDDNWYKNNLV
ncbi:MAG: NADH:flavin oxidoreductase [Anaeroplasmataceae bacterium]